MKINKFGLGLLFGAILFLAVSCDKDDPIPQPAADFTFVANGRTVTFTNTSLNSTEYVWDFGDGGAVSTEKSPAHKYAVGGTYSVKLTAVGAVGTTSSIKTMDVEVPMAVNHVKGGDFETADASLWTVITSGQKDGDGNYTNVKYAFGYSTYKPTLGTGGSLYIFPNNDAPANQFEEGTIFYQSLGALEAGDYQISFLVKCGGDSPDVAGDMQNEWFELVINTATPVVNDGYNNARVTGWIYSGWTGVTIPAQDGPMPYYIMNTNQADATGKFNIAAAGTYYLAIKVGKGGSSTFGDGIAIDKLSITKKD